VGILAMTHFELSLRGALRQAQDKLREACPEWNEGWQSHIDILFWSESSWVHSKALKTGIASTENKIGFLAVTSF